MGIGGGMPDGFIHNFNASFRVKKNLTIEQIRPLLVSVINDYLHIINDDKTIRSYLYKYPFTPEELSINLFFYDKNDNEIDDPDISVAGVSVGNLSYQSYKRRKNALPKTIKDIEESYEESIKILHEQQKS